MEKESILEKISSKNELINIFEYIKDRNYKYKLFMYCKKFQKKLNIELTDYKNNYMDQIKININERYFKFNVWENEKNSLNSNLEEDLINYNLSLDIIQNFIIKYYNKIKKEKKKKYGIIKTDYIDIYSPFFDFISKTEFFEKFFSITIYNFDGHEYNYLIKDYINKFNELNKSNIKYSSLKLYLFEGKIKFFEKYNINYTQIKKLKVILDSRAPEISKINNNYYKKFFSLVNLFNNLQYLSIYISTGEELETNLVENINNIQSLIELNLDYIRLKTTFIIKMQNLQVLSLKKCKKIQFGNNVSSHLKKLKLIKCDDIQKQESLFKFPELEELIYEDYYDDSVLIDFSSLKQLRKLESKSSYFILLENTLLEEIKLHTLGQEDNSIQFEKNLIKKILSIKTLKKIDICLHQINDEIISEIFEEEKNKLKKNYFVNLSVNKITLRFIGKYQGNKLYIFQNLFPSLTDFSINAYVINENEECKIEIKEKLNNKIDTISIGSDNCPGSFLGMTIYCGPYDKIKSFIINHEGKIINSEYLFPIFNKNNKIKFTEMNNVELYYKNISFEDFKNIYYNLDNMPNLKHFILKFNKNNINKIFYIAFIKKILFMKLMSIQIVIVDIPYEIYSKKELKDLNSNLNTIQLNNFYIYKLN